MVWVTTMRSCSASIFETHFRGLFSFGSCHSLYGSFLFFLFLLQFQPLANLPKMCSAPSMETQVLLVMPFSSRVSSLGLSGYWGSRSRTALMPNFCDSLAKVMP